MVKWVKYMLLLHMFATYITFRPLPCASLRELHASFLSELRSQSWFLPLVSEESLWLVAEAFGGAEAANATESSASSNSISIGAFVTLLGLVLALSGILVVCLCDCTCVQLCKGARRRLQALKHDVVSSHDVSRWPQGVAQMRAYALHTPAHAPPHAPQSTSYDLQVAGGVRRDACNLRAQAAARHRAGQPGGAAASQRRTRGHRAPGAPPDAQDRRLRPSQRGHATYRALTVLTILTTLTTLTMLTMLSMLTIHLLLNEVTWRRGWSLLCIGGNQSVPWYEWQAAKRTAAHIAGVSTYKPRDHPHYRDACEVILAAEQRPEEAEARRGRSLPRARREPQQTRSAD